MLTIRHETRTDHPAVGELNFVAFGCRMDEANVAIFKRNLPSFDPDLSLVAVHDGRVVGHALFNPQTIRLMDQDVRVTNLAPVAVHPDFQKQGIGRQLIRAGHEIAREKGYLLDMLLGHTTYYPKLGYLVNAFGASSVTVNVGDIPANADADMVIAAPLPTDVPALVALWEHAEARVDFSVRPLDTILEWVSPNPMVSAFVYHREDHVVGYARLKGAWGERPASVICFIAADESAARGMAAHLARVSGLSTLDLPLHPYSSGAAAFGELPVANAWEAAMVIPYTEAGAELIEAYYRAGAIDQRATGRTMWGTAFDV